MTKERIKTVEIETEIFQQTETIEKSIVETESIAKILNELTGHFGDGKTLRLEGE
ncbi:hypothetical protein ACFSHR_04750 [Azotobacter chroococcum]